MSFVLFVFFVSVDGATEGTLVLAGVVGPPPEIKDGLEDGFNDTDGLKLGLSEGCEETEGAPLGVEEGFIDTDGLKLGLSEGCEETDGAPLGLEEGFIDTDGLELGLAVRSGPGRGPAPEMTVGATVGLEE